MHPALHCSLRAFLSASLAAAGAGCAPTAGEFREFGAWQAEQLSQRESDAARSPRRLRDADMEWLLRGLLSTLASQRADEYRVYLRDDRAPQAELLNPRALLVRTGLLAALESEDELAFVLAHELAHGELAHFAARLDRRWNAQDAELAADAWAANRLGSRGFRPEAGVELLLRLEDRVEPNDRPLVAQRVAALTQITSRTAAETTRTGRQSDPRFAEFLMRYRDPPGPPEPPG